MMPFWLTASVFWIVVIIASLIVEALTLNMTAIWFALGGLAALITASIGLDIPIQLLIFVICSAIFLALIRPFVKKVLKPRGAATNADRIIGQSAIVTTPIDNTLSQGEIKLMGQVWSARSADGTPIPSGATVRVLDIVGVKAVVELI